MNREVLVEARKDAQEAVDDMPSGPLKNEAFRTILAHLLTQRSQAIDSPRSAARAGGKKRSETGPKATGTTGRLLSLKEEEVFKQQRSLADIRQILSEKGWHYRLEELGTPVMRLVRNKQLRRTQVAAGRKKIWKYSNY